MLFTIDRLQFINEKLIAFEFIDGSDKDYSKPGGCNYDFMSNKLKILYNLFKNDFYLIQYNTTKDNYEVKTLDNCKKYNTITFSSWFKSINAKSNNKINEKSKKLGSATTNVGDPYIRKILSLIYNDKQYNFSNDDNGIPIVQKALQEEYTYGFDFDLYEPTYGVVLEFLKRESNFVTNLTAHPNRYLKNYNKFKSLWNASQIVKQTELPYLFLINYSDDIEEEINLIKVIDFNKDASYNKLGIISDISYKFDNLSSFVNWLRELDSSPSEAIKKLDLYPKEIRDYEFWKHFYINKYTSDKDKNDISIGKNFS